MMITTDNYRGLIKKLIKMFGSGNLKLFFFYFTKHTDFYDDNQMHLNA